MFYLHPSSPVLSLVRSPRHVCFKVVAYPACSHTEIVQVAKVCCLVCVAGVAPHVFAKPALILLTRPVATCILSIPHKFPFELVGFCDGVDHDYDLRFRHPLFSRALFRQPRPCLQSSGRTLLPVSLASPPSGASCPEQPNEEGDPHPREPPFVWGHFVFSPWPAHCRTNPRFFQSRLAILARAYCFPSSSS